MKILITGGCGFVGSNIAVFLKKRLKRTEIFSLDNLTRKGSLINRDRLKKLNIRNFNCNIENLKKLNSLPKFNLIIDCCAEPAIEASKKDPDRVFNTNLLGTFNILKKCVKDRSNLIFLSSSRVYSIENLKKLVSIQNLRKPLKIKKTIDENFETSAASSLYGFTKLASEKLIKEIFYQNKLKYIINRFGVIAGPWQFGKQDQGFVSLWVANHLFKKKLSYIGFGGFGHQVRDIIHIDDACKIIFLQISKISKINNITLNIGGGRKNTISLRRLTQKVQKISGNKIKIRRITKTSFFDIPYFVTNNNKVKKFYKWRPLKSIDQILKDIYIWLHDNKMIIKYFK
ncbi:MAG: NAD-dependent epimerase/dehydratase family protein [Pseudomonadota bacterium]|nr:NAD-dependent epimerase/dehydratase family protein [Pseudomonadota bacterium]